MLDEDVNLFGEAFGLGQGGTKMRQICQLGAAGIERLEPCRVGAGNGDPLEGVRLKTHAFDRHLRIESLRAAQAGDAPALSLGVLERLKLVLPPHLFVAVRRHHHQNFDVGAGIDTAHY